MIVTGLIYSPKLLIQDYCQTGRGRVSSNGPKAQPWTLSPSTFLSINWWGTQKACSSDMQLTQSCQGRLMPRMTSSGFTVMILRRLEWWDDASNIPDCIQIGDQSPATEQGPGGPRWRTIPGKEAGLG